MTDSVDFRDGRRDGLKLAIALMDAEQQKWAEKMERSQSGRTFQAQTIRHRAFVVAARRIQTALNQHEKKDRQRGDDTDRGIRRHLARIGL